MLDAPNTVEFASDVAVNVATAMVSDPLEAFLIIVSVVCGLVWLSSLSQFKKVFKILPLLIWIILIPATLVGTGVLPSNLPLYINIGKVGLPLSLFYLIISCNLKDIQKLGKPAIIAALSGTLGISIGGVIIVYLFATGENADLWKGFTVISASWIGGTANGAAVQQGLGAPASVIAPLALMQTLMGFIWLIILISLAPHQDKISKILGATEPVLMDVTIEEEEVETKSLSLERFAGLIALGFVSLIIAAGIGFSLPEFGDPKIITHATWVILIISAMAIAIAAFKHEIIPTADASNLGYIFLYLMLATLGTQLNFSVIADIGVYMVAGALWLIIHLVILVAACRYFKLPTSMLALGSISNVGGIVTAPLIASHYDRRLIPVALLMAVGTQIIGIYLPFALAAIFSQIALM
ncbi:MAG: DUF819 family protein [Kordiimonadaceae bacterium]|nr:DUF819 family protein [Kordiimonadaceae bacterium]